MTPRKDFFGPDVTSSLLPEEISELLRFSEICELLRKSTGNKMDHFERVKDLRKIFRKGVYWSSDLTKGTIVSKEHLKFLKPVMFVDVVDYEELIGQKLLVDVFIDNPVRPEDISNRES
jgi:sialic acid synthase SpsE